LGTPRSSQALSEEKEQTISDHETGQNGTQKVYRTPNHALAERQQAEREELNRQKKEHENEQRKRRAENRRVTAKARQEAEKLAKIKKGEPQSSKWVTSNQFRITPFLQPPTEPSGISNIFSSVLRTHSGFFRNLLDSADKPAPSVYEYVSVRLSVY